MAEGYLYALCKGKRAVYICHLVKVEDGLKRSILPWLVCPKDISKIHAL